MGHEHGGHGARSHGGVEVHLLALQVGSHAAHWRGERSVIRSASGTPPHVLATQKGWQGVRAAMHGRRDVIEFRLKEKTRSLNESFRGDWRPRAAVAKRQRSKAMSACPRWPGGPLLCVRLTRVSPGTLDEDAVPAALKHIRDGVASRLRVDDASPLVEWLYHQAKGEAEVVVQIWSAGGGVAPPLPVGRPVERKGTIRAPRPHGNTKREKRHRCAKNGCRKLLPCAEHSHHLMPGTGESGGTKRAPKAAYTPPRAVPVSAAKEAEETFAPAPERERVHFRGASGACTCGAAGWENCR
jgi:hypothetical protein